MFQIGLCVKIIVPTGIVLFPNPQAKNRVDDVVAHVRDVTGRCRHDLGHPRLGELGIR